MTGYAHATAANHAVIPAPPHSAAPLPRAIGVVAELLHIESAEARDLVVAYADAERRPLADVAAEVLVYQQDRRPPPHTPVERPQVTPHVPNPRAPMNTTGTLRLRTPSWHE